MVALNVQNVFGANVVDKIHDSLFKTTMVINDKELNMTIVYPSLQRLETYLVKKAGIKVLKIEEA